MEFASPEVPGRITAPATAVRRSLRGSDIVQVFARDARVGEDAPLVCLPDVDIDDARRLAHDGILVCPLPDCDDRRFIVRAGLVRRHHFAHRPGGSGSHSPESVAHHGAKHSVARWLRTEVIGEGDRVVVDAQRIASGRLPDVLWVRADGTQVGFEVQLAALTPGEWQERHDDYAAAGVEDVWLFGGPTYVKIHSGKARLNAVLCRVALAGRPVVLLDAVDMTAQFVHSPTLLEVTASRGRRVDVIEPWRDERHEVSRISPFAGLALGSYPDLLGLAGWMGAVGQVDQHWDMIVADVDKNARAERERKERQAAQRAELARQRPPAIPGLRAQSARATLTRPRSAEPPNRAQVVEQWRRILTAAGLRVSGNTREVSVHNGLGLYPPDRWAAIGEPVMCPPLTVGDRFAFVVLPSDDIPWVLSVAHSLDVLGTGVLALGSLDEHECFAPLVVRRDTTHGLLATSLLPQGSSARSWPLVADGRPTFEATRRLPEGAIYSTYPADSFMKAYGLQAWRAKKGDV